MKKKITLVFVVILILFNFIYCNSVFAEEKATTTSPMEQMLPKDDDGNPIDYSQYTKGIGDELSSSTATVTPDGKSDTSSTTTSSKKMDLQKYTKNSYGSTGGVFSSIWAFVVGGWLNNVPELVVESLGCEVENDEFTIYDLVTGKYVIFNLNFYEIEELTSSSKDSLLQSVISNIFDFYGTIRNLAIALSLFVLLYIAIRMVTSTNGPNKAKYKNMFMAWFTSICILFFMHYIVIIIGYVMHLLLSIVRTLGETLGVSNIENNIIGGQLTTLQNGSKGFHLFQTLIMVTIFLYYEIKFLITYIKRFCEILFLIIISPLVTVTYAIDKVGDNKAQAFSTWLKELISKYSIQVVHAITYIIFLSAAGEIAQYAPIIAVFFLWAMGRAERMVRNVIGLGGEKQFEKAKPPRPPFMPKFLEGRPGKN